MGKQLLVAYVSLDTLIRVATSPGLPRPKNVGSMGLAIAGKMPNDLHRDIGAAGTQLAQVLVALHDGITTDSPDEQAEPVTMDLQWDDSKGAVRLRAFRSVPQGDER